MELPELTAKGNFWFTFEETYAYRLLLIDLQARISTELRQMHGHSTNKFGLHPRMYTNLSATLEGMNRRKEVEAELTALLLAATKASKARAETEKSQPDPVVEPKKAVKKVRG